MKFTALICLAVSVTGANAASSIVASDGRDNIIRAGTQLVSPNGRFTFVLQGDGNAVIYRSEGVGNPAFHTWQSGTSGRSADPYLSLQADGNLVIYDGIPRQQGDIFSIGPSGQATYLLAMQDDGNLVVYTSNRAVWSSMHGKVTDRADNCVGNDLERARCGFNKMTRNSGFGNVLSGSDYWVKNIKASGSNNCAIMRNKFPGGDIGLEILKGQYPAPDHVVGYGTTCPN